MILSYFGKFKTNFEVPDLWSKKIENLAWFFKKVVNNALTRVTTSLIFKDSFLG